MESVLSVSSITTGKSSSMGLVSVEVLCRRNGALAASC